MATAEVLAAEGFSVVLLPDPVPTPVVAFAVRHTGAAAGIQITASHNPPTDNGYKVYFDGGMQIVSPTDREIETAMADCAVRRPDRPGAGHARRHRVWSSATSSGPPRVRRASGPVRVALTPCTAWAARWPSRRCAAPASTTCTPLARSSSPIPTSPPSRSPIPRSPAPPTRCSRWPPRSTPTSRSRWILTPTGVRSGYPPRLAGECFPATKPVGCSAITSCRRPSRASCATSVVASTVVSSRMLAAIAAHYGARHVETLTGFKWLARADAELPGSTLVYAYEEAIGHCVDPAAVRDKDGISAAVLACDLVATLKRAGPLGARRAGRPGPPVRRACRCRGVAAGRRRRRGSRADAPAAGIAAAPAGRWSR